MRRRSPAVSAPSPRGPALAERVRPPPNTRQSRACGGVRCCGKTLPRRHSEEPAGGPESVSRRTTEEPAFARKTRNADPSPQKAGLWMTVLAAFVRSLFSPARAPRSACGNSCAFRGKGIMLTDIAEPKTLSDAPVQNSNASPTHRSPAEGPLPHPAIPGPQATWDRGACRPPADYPSPAPRDRGRPLPSEKLWVLLCALARPVDSRPRLGERSTPIPRGG